MLRAAFISIIPLLPGCFAAGHPSFAYTPTVVAPEADVHAFRVNSTDQVFSFGVTGGICHETDVEEIPLTQGQVDSETHHYFAYTVLAFPLSFSDHRDWHLVFYRPGYEPVKIRSRWLPFKLVRSQIDHLNWKPANDLDAQTKAVDSLLPENWIVSVTHGVRDFVIKEYERLAASSVATPEQRETLRDKARKIKEEELKLDELKLKKARWTEEPAMDLDAGSGISKEVSSLNDDPILRACASHRSLESIKP
jgi:hypothetical protein